MFPGTALPCVQWLRVMTFHSQRCLGMKTYDAVNQAIPDLIKLVYGVKWQKPDEKWGQVMME